MEMTKMLLPTVTHTPSMANDMFYPNYTNHCFNNWFSKLQLFGRNKQKKILQTVRDNYRQILHTKLVTSYKLKRVTSPTNEESNPGRYVYNIPITNEERSRAIQSESLLRPEPLPALQPEPQPQPQPVQEMELEVNLEPEPEPEVIRLEPDPNPTSNSEVELETLVPIDPNDLCYLLALAEAEWKQELESNKRRSPTPSKELELNWNPTSDSDKQTTSTEVFVSNEKQSQTPSTESDSNELMTSSEMIACLEDLFSEYLVPNPLPSCFNGVISRPRKLKRLDRKDKCFIIEKCADRMWSSAAYENTDKKKTPQRQRSEQTPAPNTVNRSLLKSQQNNNMPSTGVKYEHHQLTSDSYSSLETDEDLPLFQHDQINVSEKLSEYITQGAAMMSESSKVEEGQRCWRKTEESQRQDDVIKKNTLSDHCYHLSQSESSLEQEAEELSESSDEEEIDVVSFEKKANNKYSKFARTQRNKTANLVEDADDTLTFRRPRGRPPGPSSTKRKTDTQGNQVLKRCRIQNNQRPERRQNYTQQDEDEAETESNQRRYMHNNMERERRICLKNLFDMLKDCVPEIAGNQKVSKVSILKNARIYINELQFMCEKLQRRATYLRQQQTQLTINLDKMILQRRN